MLNLKKKSVVLLGIISFTAFSSICHAQQDPPPPNRQQISTLVQEARRLNQETRELNFIELNLLWDSSFENVELDLQSILPSIMLAGTENLPNLDINTLSDINRQLIDRAQSYYVYHRRHLVAQRALQAQLDQAERLLLAARQNSRHFIKQKMLQSRLNRAKGLLLESIQGDIFQNTVNRIQDENIQNDRSE